MFSSLYSNIHFKSLFMLFSLLFITACGGGGSSSPETNTEEETEEEVTPTVTLNRIVVGGLDMPLEPGDSIALTANGIYSNGDIVDLTSQAAWSSSDETKASVASGTINALANGATSIQAQHDGISGDLTVEIVSLVSLSLSPNSSSLALNSSESFTATGIYSDNKTEDLSTQVQWSSSNTSIASVNSSGEVSALQAGTTSIEVTMGSLSAQSSVTVNPATLQTIEISSPESLAAGLSTTLIARGTYSDGSVQDITQDVSWSVNNSNLASISNEAVLTAISSGNIEISASLSNRSTTASLVISEAVIQEIVATPSSISLAKGSNASVNVTAIFSDNTHQDVTSQTTWSSDNELFASIDTNGQINALETGHSIWTAELSDNRFSIEVTVTDAELSSINLLPINSSLPKGYGQTYSATGTYTDGSTQDITELVSWNSSDEDTAFIDNTDTQKGQLNAIEVGTATISASIGDISSSTNITVQSATLSSIEITPASATIAEGLSVLLSAKGYYSDGNEVDISDQVIWISNTPSVATPLNGQSEIKGISADTSIIAAELEGHSAFSSVTVIPATLESIRIDQSPDKIAAGFTTQLSATGIYSDNSELDITQQVTWTSSDNTVLTIDNASETAGLLRAESEGSATLSAQLDEQSASSAVTVSAATLQSIAITASTLEAHENQAIQFTATASYSDASTQDLTQDVSWYSSLETTASISSISSDAGLANTLATGTARIHATITSGDQLFTSNALDLVVTPAPNAVKSIAMSLSPNVILNNDSDSSMITATLSPNSDSGTIPDGTEVSFTISEGGNSRTETANTLDGVASLNLSSSYDGLITITASVENGAHAEGGLLSADSFGDVIISRGAASGAYDPETGLTSAGSSMFLVMQNLSNRDFNFNQILVGVPTVLPDSSGWTVLNFPDSPITSTEHTSGGNLDGGEFFAFGYALDNDVNSASFAIVYILNDSTTDTSFSVSDIFNFNN